MNEWESGEREYSGPEGIASINFPSGSKSMLIVTGLAGKRLDITVTLNGME